MSSILPDSPTSEVKLTSSFGDNFAARFRSNCQPRLVTQIYGNQRTRDKQEVYGRRNVNLQIRRMFTDFLVHYQPTYMLPMNYTDNHVIFISVLISCQSLILAKCESNKLAHDWPVVAWIQWEDIRLLGCLRLVGLQSSKKKYVVEHYEGESFMCLSAVARSNKLS